MDKYHSVFYPGYERCNCELCQPKWICPICDEKCWDREEFDRHFLTCDKEHRKEKEG